MCEFQDCDKPRYGRVRGAGPAYCSGHHAQAKGGKELTTLKCAQGCGRDKAGRSDICRPCREELSARGLKRCSNCGYIPEESFSKGSSLCKPCMKDYQQVWYEKFDPKKCIKGCGGNAVGTSSFCNSCRKEMRSRGVYWCKIHGELPLENFSNSVCHKCSAPKCSKRHYETRGAIVEPMLAQQGGQCAICARGISSETSRIDHDHECACGKSNGCDQCRRSLLCDRCNTMLGRAHDKPSILRQYCPNERYPAELIEAAIAYLDHWHAVMVERGVRNPPGEDEFQHWLAELSLFVKNGGLSSASRSD